MVCTEKALEQDTLGHLRLSRKATEATAQPMKWMRPEIRSGSRAEPRTCMWVSQAVLRNLHVILQSHRGVLR